MLLVITRIVKATTRGMLRMTVLSATFGAEERPWLFVMASSLGEAGRAVCSRWHVARQLARSWCKGKLRVPSSAAEVPSASCISNPQACSAAAHAQQGRVDTLKWILGLQMHYFRGDCLLSGF